MSEGVRRKLLIVPGFLSEQHLLSKALEGSALARIDPTVALDGRAWLLACQAIVDDDVEIDLYDWHSHTIGALLSRSLLPLWRSEAKLALRGKINLSRWLEGAREIHQIWEEAIIESDRAAKQLASTLSSSTDTQQVWLLGHSLGGRISLNVSQYLLQQNSSLPKVSAWAPAIAQSDLDWDLLTQSPLPIECYYSHHDLVLRWLFPLGQTSFGKGSPLIRLPFFLYRAGRKRIAHRAVGLDGPPQSVLNQMSAAQDISDLHLNHLSYLPAMLTLFRRSTHLSTLLHPDHQLKQPRP